MIQQFFDIDHYQLLDIINDVKFTIKSRQHYHICDALRMSILHHLTDYPVKFKENLRTDIMHALHDILIKSPILLLRSKPYISRKVPFTPGLLGLPWFNARNSQSRISLLNKFLKELDN